jgi:hypothetical protein
MKEKRGGRVAANALPALGEEKKKAIRLERFES